MYTSGWTTKKVKYLMRAHEFITERRRRKQPRYAAYGPGPYGMYGFDAGYSGDGGGGGESIDHSDEVHEEPTAHRIRVTMTDPNADATVRTKEMQKTVRVTADNAKDAIKMARDYFTRKGYRVHDHHYISPVDVDENFADGKNPQDKGDSKRHGVPTKASVSTLRKVAKQGGRKGQLAHWMANMKSGKAK